MRTVLCRPIVAEREKEFSWRLRVLPGLFIFSACFVFAGCAGNEGVRHSAAGSATGERTPLPDQGEVAREASLARRAALPTGVLDIDITNVVGAHLPARVDLLSFDDDVTVVVDVPQGVIESQQPVGAYRAYVHVYDDGVPVLVEVEDLVIREERPAYLLVNLLEGAGGVPLRSFDSDGDLAIDRVELKMGTDPYNAGSIPGRVELFFDPQILNPETRWYSGELHAYSHYGVGTESVAELVRRAERANLDFLAITDRGTLAATRDPAFRSDRLVLLPGMEWGTDEMGVALVYGPRTKPDPPTTTEAAQAECIRIQAQGGAWVIAHPAFPSKPWQWGLSFVNGVQVWFRDWRGAPPLSPRQLNELARERRGGRLIHSIAAAAAAANHGDISANAQGNLFYDYELTRGLMAGVVGGSGSGSASVPLGRPITYIHARELSVEGLLEGLRLGRTYVSSGPDGPKLFFGVDVLSNNQIDVGIGGVFPINVEVTFEVVVHDAVGMKLQVIENGRPIRTVPINARDTGIRFKRMPTSDAAYRVRVISAANPRDKGFGPLQVHALSAPIYARDITQELLWRNPHFDPDKSWVRIQSGDMIDLDLALPDQPPAQLPQW